MVSSIGQNDNVQRFSAVNALKSSANLLKKKPEETEINKEDEPSGINNSHKTLLESVDVDDIRQCATYVGEFNISDDEIKYGLLYGRSVIAEYLC